MGQVVNLSEVAAAFGKTQAGVREWLAAGMPYIDKPHGTGRSHGWKIDLGAVLDWHRRREREKALPGQALDLKEAQRRRASAEAEKTEHELALMKGEAVEIEEAVSRIEPAISNCRNKLLGIGAKVAPQVAIEEDAAACKDLIDAVVAGILTELENLSSIQEQPGGPGSLP